MVESKAFVADVTHPETAFVTNVEVETVFVRIESGIKFVIVNNPVPSAGGILKDHVADNPGEATKTKIARCFIMACRA